MSQQDNHERGRSPRRGDNDDMLSDEQGDKDETQDDEDSDYQFAQSDQSRDEDDSRACEGCLKQDLYLL
jgi:hypothetical protein